MVGARLVNVRMKKKVTICRCASRQIMEAENVAKMASSLQRAGYEVQVMPDLCALAEDEPAQLKALEGQTIVACHERAVRSLFNWRGVEPGVVMNLRTENINQLAEKMGFALEASEEEVEAFINQMKAFTVYQGTDAWFPVVDRKRCVDCGKCHDFCLFGVYSLDSDGKVQVTTPHNCKNNCPACARTCPQEAIIFPKHAFSPINGGENHEENTLVIDATQLYNQAFRERLTARRAGVALLKKNSMK